MFGPVLTLREFVEAYKIEVSALKRFIGRFNKMVSKVLLVGESDVHSWALREASHPMG